MDMKKKPQHFPLPRPLSRKRARGESGIADMSKIATHHSPLPLVGEGQGRGKILDNAKALRSNQTEVEERLWYHLRAHRFMGLKFKRQKPMGRYIVDFVCVERRLIIELDGGQHAEQTVYDQQRDTWLYGATFLEQRRRAAVGGVLEKIRSTLSPNPSDGTTSHLTRLADNASQVIGYPVNGRGE